MYAPRLIWVVEYNEPDNTYKFISAYDRRSAEEVAESLKKSDCFNVRIRRHVLVKHFTDSDEAGMKGWMITTEGISNDKI